MALADVAVSALGGSIAGMGLALFHPVVAASILRAVVLHTLFLVWLGGLFFAGRLAVALEAGNGTERLLAACALWLTFSVSSAPAGWLTYRRRR